jgi:hypothetical protein
MLDTVPLAKLPVRPEGRWGVTSRHAQVKPIAPGTPRYTRKHPPVITILPYALLSFLAVVLLPSAIFAAAVQQYGLVFEEWVRDTFFEG